MPQSQLVVRRGPRAGETFELKSQTVIIGRDSTADIIINDPEVSRNHCRLILDRSYYLQDLGSTNGTFIDGQRLGGEPVRLANGQIIQLGSNVTLLHQEIETSESIVSTRIQTGGEEPAPAAVPPPLQQPPSNPVPPSYSEREAGDRLPSFSDSPNPEAKVEKLPVMDAPAHDIRPPQDQYGSPEFEQRGGPSNGGQSNGGGNMPWSNWTQRQWTIAIAILSLLLLCTCCMFITTIIVFIRPDLVGLAPTFANWGFDLGTYLST